MIDMSSIYMSQKRQLYDDAVILLKWIKGYVDIA